jgi:NAD-reducing hydrogenase large subunit
MTQRIVIQPVTRIEGHAKVTIQLSEAGEVTGARFHVTELRGFEKFCEGRPFSEMPGLMARICGICPISHILSSAKAGDMLLGVKPPVAAVLQRRLLAEAQVLQSHALSFFHLSSPDLLLGFDAPPAERNLFALAARGEEAFVRNGIMLRRMGQQIIESVGGKRVHPNWGIPGGVLGKVTPDLKQQVFAELPKAYQAMREALDRMKHYIDLYPDEVEHMGNFPTLHVGSVNANGEPDLYDGRIRITDGEGNIIADHLDPRRYFDYFAEAAEPWSFMKFPYYKPLGYPNGMYRVGPLSRLNVASQMGTEKAQQEWIEFRQRRSANAAFHYHLARLIEMLAALERIERLFEDPNLMGADTRSRAHLNEEEGIGSCEAPRGILFHHYRVDPQGLVIHANLLIATSQNNLAINRTVEQTARRYIHNAHPEEGMLNRVEAAIRCYDPCLSCSTHALGQMPLVVDAVDPDGKTRWTLRRGPQS